MKKKMFYIMGIDWSWIYQRPHILAKKLKEDYDMTILFPRCILEYRRKKPSIPNIEARILWTIPFQEKCWIIGKISAWINKSKFVDIKENDYIYVGYPVYARYIPEEYEGKIIYDCMDDYIAMYSDQKRVDVVKKAEDKLIKEADLLIASSIKLKEKVDAIAGYGKCELIRNGAKIRDVLEVKKQRIKKEYKIYYIGTIAQWFDYPLLVESLKKNQDIKYILIGPAEKKVEDRNIVYKGVVAHEQLGISIEDADCLIMPFILNDIVLSVDPVKLYEYIAFGKCIISVYYPEVEQFSDYVYFYRDKEEYCKLLQALKVKGFPPKYTKEDQRRFLENNTWDKRYEVLKEKIDQLEELK